MHSFCSKGHFLIFVGSPENETFVYVEATVQQKKRFAQVL
jgi:hypothetical protein